MLLQAIEHPIEESRGLGIKRGMIQGLMVLRHLIQGHVERVTTLQNNQYASSRTSVGSTYPRLVGVHSCLGEDHSLGKLDAAYPHGGVCVAPELQNSGFDLRDVIPGHVVVGIRDTVQEAKSASELTGRL